MRPIIVLLTTLMPALAAAQPHCGGQTQIDANFCAKEKWEVADRELNRLWREVKPAADARGGGEALLEAQRRWLGQRDAACDPQLDSDGSAATMFYWACMEDQTVQRNATLRALR